MIKSESDLDFSGRKLRYYNPETGRFLSEDSVGFQGDDYNLYRYVENNPINQIDPSGEGPYASVACFLALAAGGCSK